MENVLPGIGFRLLLPSAHRSTLLRRKLRLIPCRTNKIGEDDKNILGADCKDVMDLRQTNKAAFRKDKDRWSCVMNQCSPAVMVHPSGC